MKTKLIAPHRPKKGIRGWELTNPDPRVFESRNVEVYGDCKNCPFLGDCRTPCESVRELRPKKGDIYELGSEISKEGEKSTYYAFIFGNEKKLIHVTDHKWFWTEIAYVAEEELPESLVMFAKNLFGNPPLPFPEARTIEKVSEEQVDKWPGTIEDAA